MRHSANRTLPILIAVAGCAIAGATLLAPSIVGAQTTETRSERRERRERRTSLDRSLFTRDLFDDYTWTILRMQREQISSQDERAREDARERRREEVELQREEDAAAHEEYFDSVIDASRAALRAPRGVYYRRPGFLSSEPPGAGARSMVVGGLDYVVDRGIFWLRQGGQYTVVTAPPGAVVDEPPAGAYKVASADGVLHYFFGTFFRATGGKYTVVIPPPRVVVNYVPDGYTLEKVDGRTYYGFGPVTFRPVFVQGVLAYQVVERPLP